MSKFYNRYLENNGVVEEDKPTFIQRENKLREIDREHVRQANMTTRGKHTGSKSYNKIMYNVHKAVNVIKSLYSGYNA